MYQLLSGLDMLIASNNLIGFRELSYRVDTEISLSNNYQKRLFLAYHQDRPLRIANVSLFFHVAAYIYHHGLFFHASYTYQPAWFFPASYIYAMCCVSY
jgi:hypothetical protein